MSPSSPPAVVRNLVDAHVAARCLHVVAELGVADALGEQPATAAELAARTGANADALNRMLRLLAAHGVFAEQAQGYVHTPESRLLRSDDPRSMRSFARMIGMPVIWDGFTQLQHAAHTGRPARDWASLVAYMQAHTEEAALFNAAMTGKSIAVVPAVLEAYDFSRFAVIADVGGGVGHLLQAILERAPEARGVLFELPHVIADVAAAASPRLQLVAGDFFVDPLPSADAYVLMEVIHDWADDDAARILAAVRRAAAPGSRLLIVEAIVSSTPGPHFGKTLDIIMLAVTGGRERTQVEYAALLEATGFRLERVLATPSEYSLLEAVAV